MQPGGLDAGIGHQDGEEQDDLEEQYHQSGVGVVLDHVESCSDVVVGQHQDVDHEGHDHEYECDCPGDGPLLGEEVHCGQDECRDDQDDHGRDCGKVTEDRCHIHQITPRMREDV